MYPDPHGIYLDFDAWDAKCALYFRSLGLNEDDTDGEPDDHWQLSLILAIMDGNGAGFDEDMFKERGGIFEWTRARDEKQLK